MNLDGFGVSGELLHYALIIALSGSTCIALFCTWKQGIFTWKESPKKEMLQHEDDRVPQEKDDE